MTFSNFIKTLFYNGLESLGKFYSCYRGYVIENYDPDGLNRLYVMVPQISNKPLSNWAFQKGGFSGDNYGFQVLPTKGSMVWVEFDHGDPKYPIWSHGHFLKDQKPEEFMHPGVYGFKTPRGQSIIINDIEDLDNLVINGGKNKGLVKVVELVKRLNDIEDKFNKLRDHYVKHVHEVPPAPSNPVVALPVNSPVTTVAPPQTPLPQTLEKSEVEDLENSRILH